jgi:lipid II:glycine glycyltransferase (peptidoglycan interpeptide bridge formation enzyme)
MQVVWNTIDRDMWDSAHAQAGASLQQDWAYGSCMKAMGVDVLRAIVTYDDRPVALAQFIVRKWLGVLSVALCGRGPVWLAELTGVEKSQAYAAIKRSLPLKGLRLVLISPEEERSQALGLSAWRRVMTGYSTVLLDISQPLDSLRAQLENRWRSNLGSAEQSELTVHRVGTNSGQYRWLLDLDMTQRQERDLEGLPIAFFDLYAKARHVPAKTILTMRADLGRDRVAGMLFLLHGEAATYQVGWTNDQGRDLHAHHLLLWSAIEELKARGVRSLDMGGVNTQRSSGVARFKIRTGGRVVTFAGTYI